MSELKTTDSFREFVEDDDPWKLDDYHAEDLYSAAVRELRRADRLQEERNRRVMAASFSDDTGTWLRLPDGYTASEARALLGRDMEQVYVIVAGSGPDTRFVEIENEAGRSVTIPRRPDEGDGMSRIGPLYAPSR